MPNGLAAVEVTYLCKRKAFLLEDGWITSLGEHLMELLDKRNMLFPSREIMIHREPPVGDDEDKHYDRVEIPLGLLNEISQIDPLRMCDIRYIGNKADYQEQMQSRLMSRFVRDIYDYEYEGAHICCSKTIWVHIVPKYRSELVRRQCQLEGYIERLLEAIDNAEKYLKGAEIVYKKINGFLPY